MNIVVGSAFRNSSYYLKRYMHQVFLLKEHAGKDNSVRLIAAEGDSIDTTREDLQGLAEMYEINLQLLDVSHGHRPFGSTEDPVRMRALSDVGQSIFDEVTEEDDVLVYVESDLIWSVEVIGTLIDCAVKEDHGYHIFSPFIFAGSAFYDVWAFRKDGRRFSPFYPYYPAMQMSGLFEVDSVGSCLIMKSEIARSVPDMKENALVEWCKNAKEQGYKIAVAPGYHIYHPTS